ncbi:MAG: hypothetical protein QM764_08005 [Chitinophagaceae bacterium]
MKKQILFLLLTASGFLANAQFNADKDPFIVKSLSGESFKKVVAETSGGSINVSGVSAGEAKIEVYVRPNNNKLDKMTKEEIQKRLDEDYSLEVAVANNELTAIAKQKHDFKNWDWKRSLSISFKIFVPTEIATKLRTSGGSISLMNLNGDQDFATSGGSLHVEKLSGKINGNTSGGSIHVIDSKDEIDLRTSGGSIEAKNCSGHMELHTSGGSLHLSDLNGNIKATTSGGSVEGDRIDGDLYAHTSGGSVHLNDLSCSVEASTSGGGIDVEIVKLGKFVRIDNSGGGISLTLPKDKGVDLDLRGNRIKVDPLNNFSGSKDDDSMTGTLNGGGVPVRVRGGRITLSMK